MIEEAPLTRGRKAFNIFAAIVLVLFAGFCAAMTASVAAIPSLRAAAEREHP